MSWFELEDRPGKKNPIVLVHGVFGSGKSFMLVGKKILRKF